MNPKENLHEMIYFETENKHTIVIQSHFIINTYYEAETIRKFIETGNKINVTQFST